MSKLDLTCPPITAPSQTSAFIGADGITVISGSSTTTISGFRTEFVSASGSLQNQIDSIDPDTTLQDAYDNGPALIITDPDKPVVISGSEALTVSGALTLNGTILPEFPDVSDLGSPDRTFRTIFVGNSGGDAIQFPPAAGTGTDYSFNVGGGNASDNTDSIFTIRFENQDILTEGANVFIFDLGTTSLLDTNTWALQSEVGGALGLLSMQVDFVGALSPNPAQGTLGFTIDSSADFSLPMAFTNQTTGGFLFLDQGTNEVVRINSAFTPYLFRFRTPAKTTGQANAVAFLFNGDTITHNAGTENHWRQVEIQPLDINNTGGTIPITTTLYITGAATEGTTNYSIWVDDGISRFDGDVLISGTLLDLTNTASGVQLPRLSNTQKDSIPGPQGGRMIFNTTSGTVNVFDGNSWRALAYA